VLEKKCRLVIQISLASYTNRSFLRFIAIKSLRGGALKWGLGPNPGAGFTWYLVNSLSPGLDPSLSKREGNRLIKLRIKYSKLFKFSNSFYLSSGSKTSF